MKKNLFTIKITIMLAILVSACAAPIAAESPPDEPAEPAPVDQAAPQPTVEESEEIITEADRPDWFAQELRDVRSGAVFSINDFNGKVVLVETLAVWCPKCLSQQQEVARLKQLLAGRDDFVSLGIGVDPNEDESLLANHVEKHGFDWMFAVAPTAVIDEISQLYGAQFLNPPATPMLIIDQQGNQHPLPFGVKSAEDLQAALLPFLDGG